MSIICQRASRGRRATEPCYNANTDDIGDDFVDNLRCSAAKTFEVNRLSWIAIALLYSAAGLGLEEVHHCTHYDHVAGDTGA